MKIIVNGCGKIGKAVLASLVAEGHDVVAIDNNPVVINDITNIYDVMGVCGNGTDSDILKEAGAENADLLVSVTNSDELNMLSCFLAKKMGINHTIARIRNPEYNDKSLAFMRGHLEISLTINPEFMMSNELFSILKLPSAEKIETFSVRNFLMVEHRIKPDSKLSGIKISEFASHFKAKVLIGAVQRGEDVYIPDGNFVLQAGDKIGITATPAEIIKFMREIGVNKAPVRKTMILGGGKTAYYLAKKLSSIGNTVTIIEKNRDVCEKLCESLPGVTIINADGSEQEVLMEEGIETVDAFVALTGMDEQNILLAAFAESKGVSKVIAKVNRNALIPLAEHLGLDTLVSQKGTVSDILVKYARALENSQGSSVEKLYKLMDNKIEALEFIVKEDFEFLEVPFKQLKLKSNILIAGIIRDRKCIIPSGDDKLMAKDKVIVLAANWRINKLSDILR